MAKDYLDLSGASPVSSQASVEVVLEGLSVVVNRMSRELLQVFDTTQATAISHASDTFMTPI